ncbi:hypothetical protein RHRU231_330225 [Rhodococcus ruber]|uniref:Uncharacterized protein n=1 Tax=Rhodococcus ruber TaxID=1830 RepID=A0A098BGB4_9NOCA|nr:hypothetical protein RHRU231_330225 [Rhodococcus ruber]
MDAPNIYNLCKGVGKPSEDWH